MTVYEYFDGFFFLPKDKMQAAKQLRQRFHSCEWCPFAEGRKNGLCHYHADKWCAEWYRDQTQFADKHKKESIDRLVESMNARCLNQLYNWLQCQFVYPDIDELLTPVNKE